MPRRVLRAHKRYVVDSTNKHFYVTVYNSLDSRDMHTLILYTLASLVPLDSLLARLMPRDVGDIESRTACHQTQRDSGTSP